VSNAKASIINGKLHLEEKGIILPFAAIAYVNIGQLFFVLLESSPGVIFNENIFGILESGDTLWQVEKKSSVYPDSPYTDIWIQDTHLMAHNWDGWDVWIDSKTGKILSKTYTK